MAEDFLNVRVGSSQRKLKVTNISKKQVTLKDGSKSEKIVFSTVEEGTGRKFELSDSYVLDSNGSKKIAGLWFSQTNGKINKSSALAKVLQYYGVESLGELKGQVINAYPDSNNYLVLTSCDMS